MFRTRAPRKTRHLRWPEPQSMQAALFLLLLLWILAAPAYVGAIHSGYRSCDFHSFYNAATRLLHHRPLYIQPGDGPLYNYLPFVAVAAMPLALLPFAAAAKICAALNVALLLVAIGIFCRTSGLTIDRPIPIALIVILAFHYWPTTENLGIGQINFLLLAVLVGIQHAYLHRRPRMLVALIVLGILLKTWMAAWLVFLLLRRMWREAANCMLATLAISALLFTIVGWREFGPFLTSTTAFANGIGDAWFVSQSLPAFLYTHFEPNPLVTPWIVSPAIVMSIMAAGALAFVWVFVIIAKAEAPTTARSATLQIGLFNLTLLLMLPMCDVGYFLLSLPLFWMLLAVVDLRTPPRRATFLLTLIADAIMTRGLPVSGARLQEHHSGLEALLTTGYFSAMALLWCVTLATTRQELLTARTRVLRDAIERSSDSPKRVRQSIRFRQVN